MTQQKTAIITAAGRGIGAAVARELAAEGYQVALMSVSGSAVELAQELGGLGLSGSVLEEADLKRLVDETMRQFGQVDAVVNNTGHPPKGDLLSISDEDWHTGLDMLVLNVIRMMRLVTPIMQAQGGGAIVNISAFPTFEPALAFPVSSSLRAALAGFTKLYTDQYGADNIRMNNVLPGYMDNYQQTEENISKIPLGRYASVQEVAKTIAFLLSDGGAYITGQNLRVDGGLTRSV